ncbi:uncharacterized protein RHTO_05793, partial [Rhodotorula toruloides NP11]
MAPPHPPSSSSASKGPPPQRRNGVLSDASNTPRQSNTPASVGTPRQSASNALKRGRVEEVDGTVDRWGRKRVFGERDWVSKEQHELETKRAQFVAAIRRKTEEEAALQRAGQGRGDEAAKIRSERGRLKEELKGIEAQISRLDGGSETSASDEEESNIGRSAARSSSADAAAPQAATARNRNQLPVGGSSSNSDTRTAPQATATQQAPNTTVQQVAQSTSRPRCDTPPPPPPSQTANPAHNAPNAQPAGPQASGASLSPTSPNQENLAAVASQWLPLQSLVDEIAHKAYTLPLKKTLKLDGLVHNGCFKAEDKERIIKLVVHLLEEVSRGAQAKEALAALGLKPANEIKTVKHIFFAV